MRFLDDFCYQALERSLCMLEDLPAFGLLPTEERLPEGEIAREIAKKVAQRLEQQAHRLEETFQKSYMLKTARVSNIYLPWRRLFEIGFDVKVELS